MTYTVSFVMQLTGAPLLPASYEYCTPGFNPILTPAYNFYTIWNGFGYSTPVDSPFKVICHLETFADIDHWDDDTLNPLIYSLGKTSHSPTSSFDLTTGEIATFNPA